MIGGNELISKNLFNEATHQVRRFLSSSTLESLEYDNKNKSPEEKSLMSILYKFSKHFLKMYGIRIVFMLITIIKKKDIKKNIFNYIYKAIFNMGNLRTSFFVASIPLIYELLHKICNSFTNTKSGWFTLLAGFITGLVSISFEDKTELVKFMIISLFARLIHSLLVLGAIMNKQSHQSKFYSYLALLAVCTSFNLINYYVPGYRPISTLFDGYGLSDKAQLKELRYYRLINDVFPGSY